MYRKIQILHKITPAQEAEYRLEMGLAAFGGPGALQKYQKEKELRRKAEIKTHGKGHK